LVAGHELRVDAGVICICSWLKIIRNAKIASPWKPVRREKRPAATSWLACREAVLGARRARFDHSLCPKRAKVLSSFEQAFFGLRNSH